MISFPVVKNLDVRKQALVKLLFIRESFAVNPFDFQGFKKDLRHGIIVAIAFAAHTLDHFVTFEFFPEFLAGILYATIRRQNNPSWWLAMQNRHIQSQGKRCFRRQPVALSE
ncbi:hypothetical protein [Chlorobium limicola]|uniref:hypothetical protein n=1 Tax=Chlorobium limicola TaxID=1092 RepID=UPI001CBB0568|nr:hypothetical protein [Chlorobium limicola]